MKEPKTKFNGYELLDARPLMAETESGPKLVKKDMGYNSAGRRDYEFGAQALVSIPQELCPGENQYYAYVEYAAGSDPGSRVPVENIVIYEAGPDIKLHDIELDTGRCPEGCRLATEKFLDKDGGLKPHIQAGLNVLIAQKGGMLAPYTKEEFLQIREFTLSNMRPAVQETVRAGMKPPDEAYENYLSTVQWQREEGIMANPDRLQKRAYDAERQAEDNKIVDIQAHADGQARQWAFDYSRSVKGISGQDPGVSRESGMINWPEVKQAVAGDSMKIDSKGVDAESMRIEPKLTQSPKPAQSQVRPVVPEAILSALEKANNVRQDGMASGSYGINGQ